TRQPAVHASQERDDGRRVPVDPPRKLLRRLHGQRLPSAVLAQIQLRCEGRRLVMNRTLRHATRVWLPGLAAAAAIVVVACMPVGAQADAQTAVNAAFNKYKTLKEGKNADYIPALAKVDPNLFGIALVTTDGKVASAGDLTTEVSIQSISKVF